MILTLRYWRDGTREQRELQPHEVSDLLEEPGCLVWLDIEGINGEGVDLLREEFGFHELALEDVIHAHQRPKIDPYEGYAFVVAYALDAKLERHELRAFVGRRYLVTVRDAGGPDMAAVAARWETQHELLNEGGGYLLYILLDTIVDGYFGVLETLENRAEDLEEQVDTGESHQELFQLRRQLAHFRRTVAPLRDIVDMLQQRTIAIVTEPLFAYYRDVYDHVLRVIDFIETLRDVLASAIEVQLTIASNRLNEVMRSLTGWGAIILVPTLIAGIYGMNFRHMPELSWVFGYPFALALMAVSALALYRVFKRKRWL